MGENLPSVTTKQNLMDFTTTEWAAFVAYVDGLTADQWTGPKDATGWSVKDHVAHVTQWDRALIQRLRNHVRLQETLGISDTSWSAGSYDPMNEEVRQLAVNATVQTVKADRDATRTDLVALLGELSEAELARSGADVGLASGIVYAASKPVLAVLVDYGVHYGEHLRYIKTIVEGQSATESH